MKPVHADGRTRGPRLPRSARSGWLTAAPPIWLALLLIVLPTGPASAQDGNMLFPADFIEQRLTHGTFEVLDNRGSRFEGDRTSRAVLLFTDSTILVAKWARAERGASDQNNEPRYEAAAYELQKLFLSEPDFVVPPTILRALPLHWYRDLESGARPTFANTRSVLVSLQYWLLNVSEDSVWDEARFAQDTAYARHFAHFNILTYLIRHNDANEGNALISTLAANPRVFAVDNGMAFSSETSNRGTDWRGLQVSSLPRATVERLRQITESDLRRQLETVAEFHVDATGLLSRTDPTGNVAPRRGVRVEGETIQLGLTQTEIGRLWDRLQDLLEDVDEGRITLF